MKNEHALCTVGKLIDRARERSESENEIEKKRESEREKERKKDEKIGSEEERNKNRIIVSRKLSDVRDSR